MTGYDDDADRMLAEAQQEQARVRADLASPQPYRFTTPDTWNGAPVYVDPDQTGNRGTGTGWPSAEAAPAPTGRDLFVDVAALLDGTTPDAPTPTLCRREDGAALFYPAAVNLVFGDPESGKTWLCLASTVEALRAGRRVLAVDADHNGAAQIVARLLALGADPADLRDRDRFRLAEPEDAADLLAVVREAAAWLPAVAVVDSLGEVLPLLDLSSSSPDDYTRMAQNVLRPLSRAGAAVLAVDHLAQSSESRRMGPTGTLAKRRAVTGLSLRVTIRETFTPERGGSAWLRVHKDRAGAVRAVCPAEPGGREQPAGVFRLDPLSSGGLSWRITDPSAERSRPATDDDIAEVDGLDPAARRSAETVRAALHWRKARAVAALSAWRHAHPDDPEAES